MTSINNSMYSNGVLRNLNASTRKAYQTMERLSSGQRINRAADDPSGLVISQQLQSQILGTDRALRNTQEAHNVLSVAEGGLSSIAQQLTQMKDLAIHSANTGITSSGQVSVNQAQLNSSLQTIARIADTTRYGGQQLLNGSADMDLQLGEGSTAADRGNVALGSYDLSNLGRVTVESTNEAGEAVSTTYSLADLYSGGSASLANDPDLAMQIIDQAISDVSAGRAEIGAYQANTLQTNMNNLEVTMENLVATNSAIADADMAKEITQLTTLQLLQQVGLKTVQMNMQNAQNVSRLLLG